MAFQQMLSIPTRGRGTQNITREVAAVVESASVENGLCHIFVQHTSASLILCENADPDVRIDLETILRRLAPDGDPDFRHVLEGPDDMSAHVRSILTNMDLTVPVGNGQLMLGVWQGIFLYEHRTHTHNRNVIVTVTG